MIRFWASYNRINKNWILTDCKDCLHTECHYVTERELPDMIAVKACIEGLELMGNTVICQIGNFEYGL